MRPIRLFFLVFVAFFASVSGTAHAGGKDARAAKVVDRIMNELFSSAKFAEAKTSLEHVLSQCDDCSPKTLALVHADLGIVLVTGLSDQKKGKAEFAKARSLDPSLTLDPAFASPEAQSAFAAAGGGAAPKAKGATPADVVLDEDDDDEDEEPKRKPPHEAKDPDEEPEDECARHSDCGASRMCVGGRCLDRPTPPKDPGAWLSGSLVQDFGILSGDQVCNKNAQTTLGFTCERSSGSQYHGTPARGSAGSASGLSLGATRLALGTEFRVADAWSLGLRMGVAIAGSPPKPDGGKSFFPLSAEAVTRYWFTGRALSSRGVGWFLGGSLGIGQGVGHTTTTVKEDPNAPPSTNQIDNPPSQKLTVYQSSGLGFVALGPGLFLPLGKSVALISDLRLSAFFPTSGFALGLSAGLAFGM